MRKPLPAEAAWSVLIDTCRLGGYALISSHESLEGGLAVACSPVPVRALRVTP